MGRNQEQFFSWWAEKSIQVQTPAGSYTQGEHSRRRGRSGAPQAGGPLVKAVHCPLVEEGRVPWVWVLCAVAAHHGAVDVP